MSIVRSSLTHRLAGSIAAGITVLALVTPPAHAQTITQSDRDSQRQRHGTVMANTTMTAASSTTVTATATSDLTPTQMLAQINAARARYGVPALTLDTSVTTALNHHANYAALNSSTDTDLSTEESSNPGYTTDGADIAPYTTLQDSSTWSAALNAWLSDPYYRDVELLDQTTVSIGFGSSGSMRAYVVTSNGNSPTGYPRSYPAGSNETRLTNGAPWLSSDYGCSGSGFPVTASWDYTVYGQASATGGSLQADGVTVPTCAIAGSKLAQAQSALVPTNALKAGTHYSGTVTATLPLLATGTSQQVSVPVNFSTYASATSIAGDQSGDKHADVFVVDSSGNLWLYKGSTQGVLGHGWKVGSGWGSYTWLSQAGDINNDGRTDLIGRRSDGNMYLFYSRGMGEFASGVQVGHGWSGLSALTVVGDMNHDGTRDLVGRTSTGDLLRYNLGTTITGGTKIGQNWNGMTHLIGVGSLNGDAYDDIVAVRSDGNLYVYYGGANGAINGSKQIGRGWTGWTALFTAGDFNGDGRLDMTGRNASGDLYSYLNTGTGWSVATKAGTGFGTAKLFA